MMSLLGCVRKVSHEPSNLEDVSRSSIERIIFVHSNVVLVVNDSKSALGYIPYALFFDKNGNFLYSQSLEGSILKISRDTIYTCNQVSKDELFKKPPNSHGLNRLIKSKECPTKQMMIDDFLLKNFEWLSRDTLCLNVVIDTCDLVDSGVDLIVHIHSIEFEKENLYLWQEHGKQELRFTRIQSNKNLIDSLKSKWLLKYRLSVGL